MKGCSKLETLTTSNCHDGAYLMPMRAKLVKIRIPTIYEARLIQKMKRVWKLQACG